MSSAVLADVDIFLLAAGLGTRLRPLTNSIPKALVPVAGKALLERHLERLGAEGAKRVIINLHHLGEQIEQFVADGRRWGLTVQYSPEPTILDTGGGIKNIEPLLANRPLLTINADVLIDSNFRFSDLVEQHILRTGVGNDQPLSTMLLRTDPDQKKYGEIAVDASGRVVRFLDASLPGGRVEHAAYMFAGIQVLSPGLRSKLPAAGVPCSITRDVLKPLLASGGWIEGRPFTGQWFDVGTPERLAAAEIALKSGLNSLI